MFGSDAEAYKNQYEQLALTPKFYAKDGAIRLSFGLDLGGATNHNGLGWRYLPGHYDANTFSADLQPTQVPFATALGWTDGAHHGQNVVVTIGNQYLVNGVPGTLPQSITGCAFGLLGAWFTTSNTVVRYETTSGQTFTTLLDGLSQASSPVEYNGYLFFSAVKQGTDVPVLAYLPPQIFPDPQRPVVPHYVSIEHLGAKATVGVYKGQLVVATNRGLWAVVPGGEANHYALGGQIMDWTLTQNAKLAVGLYGVYALDAGCLYVYSDAPRVLHGTRFTNIAGTGARIVLSNASEVAVSQGDGFVGLSGYTSAGTVLKRGNTLYVPEWQQNTDPGLVTLETVEAHLPSTFVIQQVVVSETVRSITLVTDRNSFSLRKSLASPGVWRAGYSAKELVLRIQVPPNTPITAPIIYMRPRSQL